MESSLTSVMLNGASGFESAIKSSPKQALENATEFSDILKSTEKPRSFLGNALSMPASVSEDIITESLPLEEDALILKEEATTSIQEEEPYIVEDHKIYPGIEEKEALIALASSVLDQLPPMPSFSPESTFQNSFVVDEEKTADCPKLDLENIELSVAEEKKPLSSLNLQVSKKKEPKLATEEEQAFFPELQNLLNVISQEPIFFVPQAPFSENANLEKEVSSQAEVIPEVAVQVMRDSSGFTTYSAASKINIPLAPQLFKNVLSDTIEDISALREIPDSTETSNSEIMQELRAAFSLNQELIAWIETETGERFSKVPLEIFSYSDQEKQAVAGIPISLPQGETEAVSFSEIDTLKEINVSESLHLQKPPVVLQQKIELEKFSLPISEKIAQQIPTSEQDDVIEIDIARVSTETEVTPEVVLQKLQRLELPEVRSMLQQNFSNLSDKVTQQIKVYIASNYSNSAARDMEIHLDPEFLGKLKIKLSFEGEVASLSFAVETNTAKAIVEKNMNELKEAFKERGIETESIEVSLTASNNSSEDSQGKFSAETVASLKKLYSRLHTLRQEEDTQENLLGLSQRVHASRGDSSSDSLVNTVA